MTASVAPPAPAPAPTPAPSSEPISARDAASALAKTRWADRGSPEPAEREPAHEPVESDAAPDAGGDGAVAESQPDEPALDPPKLWTKEAKERFATLDRQTQEYLIKQDEARETEIKRARTEIAERDKALAREREGIGQQRTQYEQALPVLMQMLNEQGSQFADIKTIADAEKLLDTDPLRYMKWDAHQKKIQAVQSQMQAVQQRTAEELNRKWEEFSTEQDKLFHEKLPDMADPVKAEKITKAAVSYLTNSGFEPEELTKLWHGKAGISLRDARVQLIIAEAVKYREAQEAAKKAKTQTVPPVQRPGVAQPKGASDAAKLKELSAQLTRTGSARDAAALLAARRAGR